MTSTNGRGSFSTHFEHEEQRVANDEGEDEVLEGSRGDEAPEAGARFNRHFRWDVPNPVPNHVWSFQTCLNLQFPSTEDVPKVVPKTVPKPHPHGVAKMTWGG